MKNKIIKVVTFIALLLVILVILSFIMVPKNNSKEFGMANVQANGILGEKDNTIDVLFIGDSEVYACISPMELWKEYGFTGYACSTASQHLSESLGYTYNAMQNQKPKFVILETNCIYRKDTLDSLIIQMAGKILPSIEYHNRWKNLNSNDFFCTPNYTWTDDMKGYKYQTKIKQAKPEKIKNYMKYSEEDKEITELNQFSVRLLKQYCEANGAQLILVSSPSAKNWNYQKHNGIKKLAEKEGLEYFDMNLEKDLIIDWKQDTRDEGDHLNHKGALKVTKHLGQYLASKNILENHKEDPEYHKWNEALTRYEAKVKQAK